jgi:hypothetical protein
VPDAFALAIFAVATVAMLGWKAGPLKLMAAGALAGALRDRLGPLANVRGG